MDSSGGRSPDSDNQATLGFGAERRARSTALYCAGDLELLKRPSVAIVGSRNASEDGIKRARKLARELVAEGVVIVSGLAEGIDHAAHTAAIEAGGRTIAVIGTPLDTAYPAKNKRLQEEIYRDHLLISQFQPGSRVFKGNFPARNKTMVALTDATVIVEATDSSGTHHQGWECIKVHRWLFVPRYALDVKGIEWPRKYLAYPEGKVLAHTRDILDAIL